MTWQKESGQMPEDYTIRNGILVIYRVRAEDAGTYTCVATSAAGQEQVSATLRVQGMINSLHTFLNTNIITYCRIFYVINTFTCINIGFVCN